MNDIELNKYRAHRVKYESVFVDVAKRMMSGGATLFELGRALGVNEETIRDWGVSHPSFGAAIRLGGSTCDDRAEHSLYEKLTGYKYIEKVKTTEFGPDGQPYEKVTEIEKQMPPDLGAIKYWLNNRRGNMWREKTDVVIHHNINMLSSEDLMALAGEILDLKAIPDIVPALPDATTESS